VSYDDRIDIVPPGHLPNNLTAEKIRPGFLKHPKGSCPKIDSGKQKNADAKRLLKTARGKSPKANCREFILTRSDLMSGKRISV
jgi:hypothetical protein